MPLLIKNNLTSKEEQQIKTKLINFINIHHGKIHKNIESYKGVVTHLKSEETSEELKKKYDKQTEIIEIGREHGSPLNHFKQIHKLYYHIIQATANYNNIINVAFESYNDYLETSHEEIKDQIGGDPFRFLTKDHHNIVDGVLDGVGIFGLSCFGLLIASTAIVLPPIGIVVVGIGCFALATWLIVGAVHALTKVNDDPAEMYITQQENGLQQNGLITQQLQITQTRDNMEMDKAAIARGMIELQQLKEKYKLQQQEELTTQQLKIQKIHDNMDKAHADMEKDKPAIARGMIELQKLKGKYKQEELLKGGGIYITYKDILDISKSLFVNIRLSKDAKDFIIQFVNNNVKPRPKKQTKQQTTILSQNSKRFMHIDIQHLQMLVIKLINKGMKKIQKQDSKTLHAVHFL
jgi:hypothetical protein